ncbi:hypothetical protein QBC43DRAFT_87272 [Cladorrhinum sp. PSN259]|nr:hypothetical protein QBC43DRAFT_87272 [Cladorrhinum sp. PSN259]
MSTITSYAQAARGQATSQSSPQLTSSSAPSTADVSGSTSVTAPSVASNVTEARDGDSTAQPDIENGLSKLDNDAAEQGDCNSSTVSAIEQGEKPSQDPETKSRSSQRQTAEKGSRSASRTSRANDGAEGKKSRKGKKRAEKDSQTEQAQDDSVEKQREPLKSVVLTEAAIPAVNPWTKRAEGLQSKVKVTSPAPNGSDENKSQESAEDGNAQPVSDGVSGDKPAQKKPVEASRAADTAPRRAAPRGARGNDKDDKAGASLPPVADASFWPDPKSAALKEQQQSVRKPQEKPEAGDKDSQDEAGTTRKTKWAKVQIDHSVVFETQLPTPRGSKPRGGARGGRESGSMRGNLNTSNVVTPSATASSTEKTGPSGGPSGPKPAATRPRESSVPTRPAPQAQAPAASKRASVDSSAREQRKPSVSGTQEQSREISENPTPPRRGPFTKDIRTENGPLSPEDTQTFGRPAHHERHNGTHAHVNGHGFREGRPERGRGGYRSRGGHNGASSSHAGSAQFAGNGYNGPQAGYQPRQNSSAHSPPPFSGQFPQTYGHSGRGRGKWAGQHGRNGNGANPSGFPSRAAPAASEFSAAAPMFAPMVQPVIWDYYGKVQILKTQIEYYFSLENLVKDLFLRRHMDGGGFVPVSVITNFGRIKKMQIDIDMIRQACMSSDALEIVRGEDEIERIRSTTAHNRQFVLPEDQRVEEARNNGPIKFEVLYATPVAYPPVYPQFYDEQAYNQAAYANGVVYNVSVNGGPVNGHYYGHETQLSAGVPEFAPKETTETLENPTKLPHSHDDQHVVVQDSDGTPASFAPTKSDIEVPVVL